MNTLPVIEIMIDTIVYEILMKHIKNGLLTKYQSGEQCSAETVVQLVTEDWLSVIYREAVI